MCNIYIYSTYVAFILSVVCNGDSGYAHLSFPILNMYCQSSLLSQIIIYIACEQVYVMCVCVTETEWERMRKEWVCLLYTVHALCTHPCPYPTLAHIHTHTRLNCSKYIQIKTHVTRNISGPRFILFLDIIDTRLIQIRGGDK